MRLIVADWFWRAVYNVVAAMVRFGEWERGGWRERLYLDVAGRSLEAETLRDIAEHPEHYR